MPCEYKPTQSELDEYYRYGRCLSDGDHERNRIDNIKNNLTFEQKEQRSLAKAIVYVLNSRGIRADKRIWIASITTGGHGIDLKKDTPYFCEIMKGMNIDEYEGLTKKGVEADNLKLWWETHQKRDAENIVEES